MNMLTRLYSVFVYISFVIILLINSSCSSLKNSSTQENEFRNLVETKARIFLESIPEEYLINYSIKDQAEIEKGTIGHPVIVYSIVNDSLVSTNTWRVPLIINEDYKALLTLTKDIDNNYEIVDFGASILAQEFSTIANEKTFKGMLRVFELRKDFFIIESDKGQLEFLPIPNLENKKYTMKELVNMIN